MKCYHKLGKEHIVLDALLHLDTFADTPQNTELDFDLVVICNFTASLVQMKPDFKAKILQGYAIDLVYCSIIKQLCENTALNLDNQANLFFYLNKELIWYNSDYARLCIPKSIVGDILKIEHNNIAHPGFSQTYQ